MHNFLLCHSLDLVRSLDLVVVLVSISLLLLEVDMLCIDLVAVELLSVQEVHPAGYSIPVDVKAAFVSSWANRFFCALAVIWEKKMNEQLL